MKKYFLSLIAGLILVFASCAQRPEVENCERQKMENCDITAWTDIAGNDKIAVIFNGELREYSVENGSLSYISSDSTNTYCCFANDPNYLVAITSAGTAYACKGKYGYEYNQTDVSDWHDLISIYTNGKLTVGLTSDGSVLVTDSNN